MLFYPQRSESNIDYICVFGAIKGRTLDREKCSRCESFDCVEKWKNPCCELVGFEVSPEEMLEEALAAKEMFGKAGGMTFGGGEPTLQNEELLKTLKLLKEHGINTAIETNASTESFKKVLDLVDLLICDFKCFDDAKHKRMTGISNKNILKNLALAIKNKSKLWIRIPLVPGLNDSEKEMDNMADFLHETTEARDVPLKVEILRMHHLGKPKYDALEMDYQMENIQEPGYELAEIFSNKLANNKIIVAIGG
jgi:pyruvate formate lyase activating enzyme